MSRGTALTVVEGLPKGGLVRENGLLRRVPAAWKTRVIDFGIGPAKAITIPCAANRVADGSQRFR